MGKKGKIHLLLFSISKQAISSPVPSNQTVNQLQITSIGFQKCKTAEHWKGKKKTSQQPYPCSLRIPKLIQILYLNF